MGRLSLLLITLTVYLSSLIQTSHSLDKSDSVRIPRRTSRHSSPAEVIFLSESSSDSVEGSGHSVDSTAWQKLIHRTVVLKKPERAGNENRSGSGITLTPTPALTLHHSGARDRADGANASITGHTHSSVHIISEKAPLEGSHIATEEQLQESRLSIVNDDFLGGK